MLENNNEFNFEQYVLDGILETTPGAVKDFYLSLNPEENPIEESEIEWMRKIYTKKKIFSATFTLVARGSYETSFFVHEYPSKVELMMLFEYAMENYHGYVDEFYDGDKESAPRFKYGLISIGNSMEEAKDN